MKPSFWQRLLPTLLLVLCCSCVTADPQKSLESDVQAWVGLRQEDVVTYWGEADEVLEIGEGERVLQYEADVADTPYPCVVIFSVNRYGFVLGSKFNGDIDSCRGFVKVIPEEQRNLVRENNLVILEAIDNLRAKVR